MAKSRMPQLNLLPGIEQHIMATIEHAILGIGQQAEDIIKASVQDVAFDTGRLRDSISYSTSNRVAKQQGAALADDMIEKPETPKNAIVLHIGTACPYAPCIEYGSSYNPAAIKNPAGVEGSGSMLERLKSWATRHGMDEKAAYGIIRNMMRRSPPQLPPRPFMTTNEVKIEDIAKKALLGALREMRITYPTVDIQLDISVSKTHLRRRQS